MSFEVASIREDPSGKFYVPVPTDSDDDFVPTGGSFTASMPLKSYIAFAYKLSQQHSMLSHLPSWASSKSFELHAKAAGNPTKDQYRLMVQSLLAERFKLAIRFETQDTPVLVMTLARAGKMGPGLRLHADGPACDVVKPRVPGSAGSFDMFPCGVYLALNQPDHSVLAGARNTTVELMAAFITNIGHERAIVDRTGIIGKIDFSMEYMPEVRGVEPQPEMPGTTFLGAVKDPAWTSA